MTETFLLKIKEQNPELEEFKDEVSEACTCVVSWTQKVSYRDPKNRNRIDIQTYDAKDALVGWIEIENEDILKFPIECIMHDMSWLYQPDGVSELEENENYHHKKWTNKLEKDEYVVLYTSLEEHTGIINTGLHKIFFFTLNASWLKRHSSSESKRFLEISTHLYGKGTHSYSSSILKIRPEIHGTIKRIVQIDPSFEGLDLDNEIYNYVIKLISYSKEDLDSHITFTNYTAQRLLKKVHTKINELTKEGKEHVKVKHVTAEFNISQQYLYRIHMEEFGYSLKEHIVNARMELAKEWVLDSSDDITVIAYEMHYPSVNNLNKAYRNHFGILPSDHRKKPTFETTNKKYEPKK